MSTTILIQNIQYCGCIGQYFLLFSRPDASTSKFSLIHLIKAAAEMIDVLDPVRLTKGYQSQASCPGAYVSVLSVLTSLMARLLISILTECNNFRFR